MSWVYVYDICCNPVIKYITDSDWKDIFQIWANTDLAFKAVSSTESTAAYKNDDSVLWRKPMHEIS